MILFGKAGVDNSFGTYQYVVRHLSNWSADGRRAREPEARFSGRVGEAIVLRIPRGDGLSFASLRPWVDAVVCAVSVGERRTNDAARSGAHAPDRECHTERDCYDTGAQGSCRSNARLRGSTSTDASHHPLGH